MTARGSWGQAQFSARGSWGPTLFSDAIRVRPQYSFITDGSTVRDIVAHRGAPTAPPLIAPARGPPLRDLPAAGAGGGEPHADPAPGYEFDQRVAW
jgi:hypothetical protein